MTTALVVILAGIVVGGVVMQLIALAAWRIESQDKETRNTFQRGLIAAGKVVADIDTGLGVILKHWARYPRRYDWIVAERVFTLFVWGVAASALAALGRETDDWQLTVTSSALFCLHGLATGVSIAAIPRHFLRRGSPRSMAILAHSLGFLMSVLFYLWMAGVFSKIIQATTA